MLILGPGPSTAVPEKNTDDVNVLYEDNCFNYKNDVSTITASNIGSLLTIGTRVIRGPDWKWGDQVKFVLLYLHSRQLVSGLVLAYVLRLLSILRIILYGFFKL